MNEKMSRWGVGPAFAVLSIRYTIIMSIITRFFHPVFQINIVPSWFLSIIGMSLVLIGVLFLTISVKTVMRAYNTDTLVADGIFKCCRHPLYASWVVFIVPGIALLLKSWTLLTTPIFMYFLLLKLAKKEELYLEHLFGSKYLEYKIKVPCILPIGCFKQSYNKANSVDEKKRAAD
jgi:protein-S-isoprenylcysteine O-methyltransferase Ste14